MPRTAYALRTAPITVSATRWPMAPSHGGRWGCRGASVGSSTTCRLATGRGADACPPHGGHRGLVVFTLVAGVTMRDQAPELLLLFGGQHLSNILHQRDMRQPEVRLLGGNGLEGGLHPAQIHGVRTEQLPEVRAHRGDLGPSDRLSDSHGARREHVRYLHVCTGKAGWPNVVTTRADNSGAAGLDRRRPGHIPPYYPPSMRHRRSS
jgi:hypothetical protein